MQQRNPGPQGPGPGLPLMTARAPSLWDHWERTPAPTEAALAAKLRPLQLPWPHTRPIPGCLSCPGLGLGAEGHCLPGDPSLKCQNHRPQAGGPYVLQSSPGGTELTWTAPIAQRGGGPGSLTAPGMGTPTHPIPQAGD